MASGEEMAHFSNHYARQITKWLQKFEQVDILLGFIVKYNESENLD